ncbi:hypothetical protein XCR_2786 [Xanthomonas campestris pv. raphani 756C]|nr:hypothetical protein XCR_2786 [Xanthomonas campestris pv. raphani 756C]
MPGDFRCVDCAGVYALQVGLHDFMTLISLRRLSKKDAPV